MNQYNHPWQQKYHQDVPKDYGITSPQGHNVHPIQQPVMLTANELNQFGATSNTINPSSQVTDVESAIPGYLLSAAAPNCAPGCVQQVKKPDPRNLTVKPLYVPHTFKPDMSRNQLSLAGGMYP